MRKPRGPRALTLTLPNAKQPVLLWQGERYTLRNFSHEGIGLWIPANGSPHLTPGSQMSADVVIGNEIYPAKMEIRHRSPGLIGLKFLNPSAELTKLFASLMEPSVYAATLQLKSDEPGEDLTMGYPRLWYRGEGNSELVLWYNGFQRMLIAMQLCWLGKWVFRHQYEEVATGYVNDGVVLDGRKLAASKLVIQPEHLDLELLQNAAQFLTSVPAPLPGAQLWQFLEMGGQIYLSEEVLSKAQVA